MTTTTTIATAKAGSALGAILFVAALGLGMVFLAGMAQSASLHDAAHDTRHSTGFPCH